MMSELILDAVDCDASPRVPYGSWRVHEHIPRGKFLFDSRLFGLHLLPTQESKPLMGSVVKNGLKELPTANANLLEYLLLHPDLFPNEWKIKVHTNPKCIFFWSTTYADSHETEFVRCLYFATGHLQSSFYPLTQMFYGNDVALIHAE